MATVAQKGARRAGDNHRLTAAFALPVTAVANTDFIFALPAAARDIQFRTKTSVASLAATDLQIQIGKTVGGSEYVAAVSVKAQGQVSHVLVGAAMADLDLWPGSPGLQTNFNVRCVQSGAASATFGATLFVDYSIPV